MVADGDSWIDIYWYMSINWRNATHKNIVKHIMVNPHTNLITVLIKLQFQIAWLHANTYKST